MPSPSQFKCLALSALLLSTPSAAFTDRAFSHGRFFAAVSAVEDRCERYYAATVGFTWDDLSPAEYRRVLEVIQIEKPRAEKLIKEMTCYRAAHFVAQLGQVSPSRLWEIR